METVNFLAQRFQEEKELFHFPNISNVQTASEKTYLHA